MVTIRSSKSTMQTLIAVVSFCFLAVGMAGCSSEKPKAKDPVPNKAAKSSDAEKNVAEKNGAETNGAGKIGASDPDMTDGETSIADDVDKVSGVQVGNGKTASGSAAMAKLDLSYLMPDHSIAVLVRPQALLKHKQAGTLKNEKVVADALKNFPIPPEDISLVQVFTGLEFGPVKLPAGFEAIPEGDKPEVPETDSPETDSEDTKSDDAESNDGETPDADKSESSDESATDENAAEDEEEEEETPAAEDAPAGEEKPAAEDAPAEEDSPAAEDAPADENAPAYENVPADSEMDEMPGQLNPVKSTTVVVHLLNPVNVDEVAKKINPEAKLDDASGLAVYRAPAGANFHFVDDRTLVLSDASTIDAVLQRPATKSELGAKLAALTPEQLAADVVLVVSLDGLRAPLQSAAESGMLPPQVAMAKPIVDGLASLTLAFNSQGQDLLQADILAGAPEMAEMLEGMMQGGVKQAQAQLPQLEAAVSPDSAVAKQGAQVAKEALEGLTIKRADNLISVRLKRPKGLEKLLEMLPAELKKASESGQLRGGIDPEGGPGEEK